MEFKDKIKKIRTEKGLSQQALADAIFVSRSAVAKWENGLGLPSKESYQALCQYFQVEDDYFNTSNPEEIIVTKNQRIGKQKIIGYVALALIIITNFTISILIMKGGWGFTPEMAAGKTWADSECIENQDYIIYYNNKYPDYRIEMSKFKVVRKNFYGYTVRESDHIYKNMCDSSNVTNRDCKIYSLKGRSQYYHIIQPVERACIINDGDIIYTEITIEEYLAEIDKVTVDGIEYPVQLNSYFETPGPITEFTVNGHHLKIMAEE